MARYNYKHGLAHTPIYWVWHAMIQRCSVPSASGYEYYGARGIKVCDEWKTFGGFYDSMGDRPEGLTLDRIDPDGHYTPENCRWADTETQARNQRIRKDNRSGLKGVAWCKTNKTWMAYANENGKRVYLKRTPDFFEACCARKSQEIA